MPLHINQYQSNVDKVSFWKRIGHKTDASPANAVRKQQEVRVSKDNSFAVISFHRNKSSSSGE